MRRFRSARCYWPFLGLALGLILGARRGCVLVPARGHHELRLRGGGFVVRRRLSSRALALNVRLALLGSVVGLAVVLDVRAANACSSSQPPAPISAGSFAADSSLPANLRGIPFVFVGPDDSDAGAPVRVLDSGQREVAGSFEPPIYAEAAAVSSHMFVPSSALAPGRYTLDFGTGPSTFFTIAPAAPIPVPAITATTHRWRGAPFLFTTNGSCVEAVDSEVIEVTLTLAEDYRPYLALTTYGVSVATQSSGVEHAYDSYQDFRGGGGAVGRSLTSTVKFAHRCDGTSASVRAAAAVQITGLEGASAGSNVDLYFPACSPGDADGCSTVTRDSRSIVWSAYGPLVALAIIVWRRHLRRRNSR